MTETKINSEFCSTMNKGFRMTFDNGWTISIQWGTGNYCSRGRFGSYREEMKLDLVSSPDCEIMIWWGEGKQEQCYDFGGDQVKGYCDTDEVAEWIWKVKNFPK